MNQNDEWYTPKNIIDRARDVFNGHEIDFDPASNANANNKLIKASTFHDIDNSSLEPEISWNGRVWLNPPYSKVLLSKFLAKAVQEFEDGNVSEMIILTNSGTDTQWNQIICQDGVQVYTIGRIAFIDGNTMEPRPTTGSRGQCLTYFGHNAERFIDIFTAVPANPEHVKFWAPNHSVTF